MRKQSDGEPRPVPLIDPDRCDGCGLCARACPAAALTMSGGLAVVSRPEACDYAGLCEMICPRQAIRRPFEIVDARPAAETEAREDT